MADELTCVFSDRAKNKEKCCHRSVVQRYYTPKYKIDKGENHEDHCILTHSNKICIVALAPSHPIVKEKKNISEVSYQIDAETNRLTNKVEGKSKKGAHNVIASSPLCRIKCEDGSNYIIRSCIKGQVMEVNSNLIENPQLLTEKTWSEGYIGILLCKLKEFPGEMKQLLTEEQYQDILAKRLASENVT